MAQPIEQENVTYNALDGALFGRTSTKLLGFYGTTPTARLITASTSQVSTTTTVSLSTAGVAAAAWGFASQAEINNFVTAVSTIQISLKNLGIVA